MSVQAFSLVPFPAGTIPEITITGTISRRDRLLDLHYELAGNLREIILPSPSSSPGRKAELWKTTCFEFFLARKDQPQYWEFNMSPSGDWNVYRMDAYRRIGFKEEASVQPLSFEWQKVANVVTLDAKIDLNPIFQLDDLVEAGITAVIQTKDGSETYWALIHPAPQADFHLRESFILPLARQTHLLRQSALGG
jgi:hypothetical protein